MKKMTTPQEGDLYKTYQVDTHTFHIRYGYYEENERGRVEPLPIFPDLIANPLYTVSGQPIVTLLQAPCREYDPRDPYRQEEWCGDCRHYAGGKEELGTCQCQCRKLEVEPT